MNVLESVVEECLASGEAFFITWLPAKVIVEHHWVISRRPTLTLLMLLGILSESHEILVMAINAFSSEAVNPWV